MAPTSSSRRTGDSMIEAGILDGHTIVVERGDERWNGDYRGRARGRGRVGGRGHREDVLPRGRRRVRLQPENAALEPIDSDHARLLGKVVGVFRSLR